MSERSNQAYRLYSLCYPPLALLAYLLVWRGRLLKHIAFFRNTLDRYSLIVDLATGDGTLTKKALFPFRDRRLKGLLALDISEAMLKKAKKKLPVAKTGFIHGDVLNLPFEKESVKCFTCFGGFNSFSSGADAMKAIAQVLSPSGVLRGSVLFTPKASWRRKAVDLFIRWGLQTEHVDRETFLNWIHEAGLNLKESAQYGDVFLFEVGR